VDLLDNIFPSSLKDTTVQTGTIAKTLQNEAFYRDLSHAPPATFS